MQCCSINNPNASLEEYYREFSLTRAILCPQLVAPGCFPLLDNTLAEQLKKPLGAASRLFIELLLQRTAYRTENAE